MNLNKQQIECIQQVWQTYVASGEKFVNASEEYTHNELDQRRRATIPEVMDWLKRFLDGEVALEEFKTAIDGINKRNRLWGFRGINGQMFFNMLTKNSQAGDRLQELTAVLKQVLSVPGSLSDARRLFSKLTQFTQEIGKHNVDMRSAPKVGSIPYFLSYFWQIQQPEIYPVYYTSMITALSGLDIWIPHGNVVEDYPAFYELNHEILNILSKQAGKPLLLWDIEHAFWFHVQIQTDAQIDTFDKVIKDTSSKAAIENLPESYIPPIVSILPGLAANDETLAEICRRSGRAIEKVFEERLAILFRMLGYETRLLGQGHGRVPDGVAISQEFRYAIIYDAKVRQQSYTMGTDERAFREYIAKQGERLRKQGMRNLYFMVISSGFSGDHDDTIRSLKIETNVNEVLLVEVKALLAMLEGKLRNPDISLGPDGIQRELTSSGLLTESDVREFMEI